MLSFIYRTREPAFIPGCRNGTPIIDDLDRCAILVRQALCLRTTRNVGVNELRAKYYMGRRLFRGLGTLLFIRRTYGSERNGKDSSSWQRVLAVVAVVAHGSLCRSAYSRSVNKIKSLRRTRRRTVECRGCAAETHKSLKRFALLAIIHCSALQYISCPPSIYPRIQRRGINKEWDNSQSRATDGCTTEQSSLHFHPPLDNALSTCKVCATAKHI